MAARLTPPLRPPGLAGRPSLLAVFAHPDDESFLCGGTLAWCAHHGVRVTLVCATRGEAGRVLNPDLPPATSLPALREDELRRACAALGVEEVVLLGHHDSGHGHRLRGEDPRALVNVPPAVLERQLLDVIGRTAPQVVVTFDPHGLYGHPDHLAVHRAATAAFHVSGHLPNPPQRLWYGVPLADDLRAMQGRPCGMLGGLPPEVFGISLSTAGAVMDVRPHAARKRRALTAHRSQLGPTSTLGLALGEEGSPLYEREAFSLGGTRTSLAHYPLRHLFEGLDLPGWSTPDTAEHPSRQPDPASALFREGPVSVPG